LSSESAGEKIPGLLVVSHAKPDAIAKPPRGTHKGRTGKKRGKAA